MLKCWIITRREIVDAHDLDSVAPKSAGHATTNEACGTGDEDRSARAGSTAERSVLDQTVPSSARGRADWFVWNVCPTGGSPPLALKAGASEPGVVGQTYVGIGRRRPAPDHDPESGNRFSGKIMVK